MKVKKSMEKDKEDVQTKEVINDQNEKRKLSWFTNYIWDQHWSK